MLGVLLAFVMGGSPASPVAEAAVKGVDLCVQMQSGRLDLRGEDRNQSKTMVLPSETGPGGVFLELSPRGCDVLIGSDGEASLEAIRAWIATDTYQLGWRNVPSLGVLGQGERGDGAQYFAAIDHGLSLAMGRPLNQMGRILVMPKVRTEQLRLRVDTASRAARRTAGAAVIDAVHEVCPLLMTREDARTEDQKWLLWAQLRTFSGTAAEMAHADEERDTVMVNADESGCRVALRAKANSQIAQWEQEVPQQLETARWQPYGVNEWRGDGGRSVWINSAPGLMLVEVVSH